jgi:hypothetical protein
MLLLPSVLDRESGLFFATADVSAAKAELEILLLQRVKLGNDIARMRKFLRRIAQSTNSHLRGAKSTEELCSTRPSGSKDSRRRPVGRGARRSQVNGGGKRPMRWELERACRIALMETNEPASAEKVYDRIHKRGSLTFAGYKRPFRAIALAMNALVKQGEASLFKEEGSRRWRWETERAAPCLNNQPLSLASESPRVHLPIISAKTRPLSR